MILEVDCGNTNIKWRIIENNKIIIRGKNQKIISFLNDIRYIDNIQYCRMVSVRTEERTQRLIESLNDIVRKKTVLIKAQKKCANVINNYEDPFKLGSDRFVAMIAAFDIYKKATMIVDLGTAITIDLINKNGTHLGGIIVPGSSLMRHALKQTALIKDIHKNNSRNMLGFNTQNAVTCGCNNMIDATLNEYIQYARKLDSQTDIFFTGGGSKYFNKYNAIYIQDLVLDGLKLAAPF